MKTINKDKILYKIALLLKKAESSRGLDSMEEAQSFFSKANELILRHNLSIEEVENQNLPDQKEEIIMTGYKEGIQYQHKAAIKLVNVLCDFHYCSMVLQHNYEKSESGGINLIGRKSQIEIVKYMYSVCSRIFSKIATRDWRRYQLIRDAQTSFRSNFIFNWFEGAAIGLKNRLEYSKEQLLLERSTALNLYEKQWDDIKEFKKIQLPNLISTQKLKYDAMDLARDLGYRTGYNTILNKGLYYRDKVKINDHASK